MTSLIKKSGPAVGEFATQDLDFFFFCIAVEHGILTTSLVFLLLEFCAYSLQIV